MSLLRSVLSEQAAYGRAALAPLAAWPEGGQGTPVVMVPGLGAHPKLLAPLATVLARGGSGPLSVVRYASFTGSFQALVAAVATAVHAHDQPVDLVGHSLGGLAARVFVKSGGAARVRRLVSLCAPQHGTRLWIVAPPGLRAALRPGGALQKSLAAGKEPVPTLSVASLHDHQVRPPASAAIPGARHVDVVVGHTAAVYDPHVQRLVGDFLR